MQTPGLTFKDFKTRLALYMRKHVVSSAGVGPATDVNTDFIVTTAFNDGVQKVLIEHEWSWIIEKFDVALSPDGSGPLNVNSDPTQYRLPESVLGVPTGEVRLLDDADGVEIEVKAPDVLERWLSRNSSGGRLQAVSFEHSIAAGSETGERQAWVMKVFPKPLAAGTVRAYFRKELPALSEDAERGPWPAIFDQLMVAAGVLKLNEMGMLQSGAVSQLAQGNYDTTLAKAIELDNDLGRAHRTGAGERENCDEDGGDVILNGQLVT